MLNANIVFKNPEVLYLLFILLPLIVWYVWKQKEQFTALKVSDTSVFNHISGGFRTKLRHLPFFLRLLGLAGIIVALARPQSFDNWEDSSIEGIDIVLANDVSSSMKGLDMNDRQDITRLEVAQNLAAEFVDHRPNDNIGIVIFAGESLSPCPLTTDHTYVKRVIAEIDPTILNDGTAIGMGLGSAVNLLRKSEAKSKVVVLLTDGENNQGTISPLTAAEFAKTFGVKVYTIGLGSNQAEVPVAGGGVIQGGFDGETLEEIATKTGGKFYRATSQNDLKEIYAEIDLLEKTEIDVTQFQNSKEEFHWILLIAIGCLFMEVVLRNTFLSILS